MPKRIDPSRTATIRRAFVADMRRRFVVIKKAIRELVVEEDVFGLVSPLRQTALNMALNIERQAWRFRTDPQKVDAFRAWLSEQVDASLLELTAAGKPWVAKYIESSYKKGKLRAYKDTYGELVETPDAKALLDRQRLLGVSLTGPIETARIEGVYSRAFTDLKGVTDTMSQQLSRTLSLGLAQGQNPLTIAREMTKQVDGLERTRARLIARTEVIASHAEAQLDGFDELGIKEVTVHAEWLTAGDERVCGLCEPMEGAIITVQEARGLIPRHPNCRCAWVPVTDEQLEAKEKFHQRIRQSILGERKAGTSFKEAKGKSSWLGKERVKKTKGRI